MEILELVLETDDLSKTEFFYTQILGFDTLEQTENQLSFRVGTSQLIFRQVNTGVCPKYHFAFNIPGNKLNEAILWILKKVPLLETEEGPITYFENWDAKAIYFYDNNQNILEFITREGLNNSSDEDFTSDSILNINEVGIVTDKPIELGNSIIQKTKTDFFAKGPKREDFAAVGNELGLFVISNPNRNWYPTRDRAEMHTVETKIKVGGAEFELRFN